MGEELVWGLLEERRCRRREVVERAVWEADMFLRYGDEWLRQVVGWLDELDRATQEQLRDPAAREALLASILVRDRLRREGRLSDLYDD